MSRLVTQALAARKKTRTAECALRVLTANLTQATMAAADALGVADRVDVEVAFTEPTRAEFVLVKRTGSAINTTREELLRTVIKWHPYQDEIRFWMDDNAHTLTTIENVIATQLGLL